MAGKGSKVYNISEQQLEVMMEKASRAGIAAYKKEHEEDTRRKVDRLLYRTKTLLEKYRELKAYADNEIGRAHV